MRKEASLPVRLDSADKRRLQDLADRTGITVSALVRLLVRSFVDEYDRDGGRGTLPLFWGKTRTAVTQKVADRVSEDGVPYEGSSSGRPRDRRAAKKSLP